MQKLLTFFFSKTISIFAIVYDQSFNDSLTNDIVSFEQLGPEEYRIYSKYWDTLTITYLSSNL